MNQVRAEFEKQLQSTEQCKFLVQVYLKHYGHQPTSSKKSGGTDKIVPTSKSTAVFKKERESVLLALIENKEKSTEMAILLMDHSTSNNTFRIRDFHTIRKHDFGIKIVDELHFDLFFRQKALVLNFQCESASTQWLAVSSLVKASKLINDQESDIMDFPETVVPPSNPQPTSTSSSFKHRSLFNSTSETGKLSLTEFLDVETTAPISNITMSDWTEYYVQRMQTDQAQKHRMMEENQDISIDKFKKTKQSTNNSTSNTASPSDIYKKATINSSESDEFQEKSRKDNWIQRQLKAKEEEFTDITPISIVICTWNVNNKFPSTDTSLRSLLHLDDFEADIYAIGMQEIDMTAGALLKEETETGSEWQQLLTKTFDEEPKQNKYKLVTARQLVGIYHCIFIKETFANDVKEIMNTAEGVGVLGMMGNKGGVGIRFKLFDSTFCFITAHLAPHMGAVERRNQNFHEICKRTDFGNPTLYRPDQHDFFFWYGDLNYRINQPNNIVREKIKQQDFKFLLKYDQLMIEKNAKNAFVGFSEGEITFDPTYKFDSGTDIYDTSEKGRVPSYTDRILWRDDQKNKIVHKSYKSFKEYKMSDHKPVTACFEVGVKTIVEEKYKKCYLDIIKMLDKLENDMLPEVAITGQSINYEVVKYDEPNTQIVLLKNTGQVVCEYQFVPKPHESFPSKPYVSIEPLAGYIIPGETEEIKVTICVNSQKAPKLLSGDDTIDDILILHLKNGRDHFISITGTYVQSCFGSSLDKLVKLKNPILRKDEGVELSGFEKDLRIPKEMWRLIDLLYNNGMKEEGLFEYSGVAREVHYIRDCLDSGAPITDPVSNHSIAEALLTFLESLREPVVPSKFYQMCLNASSNPATCYHLISMLPDTHFTCFHYLMAFLREILKHKHSNSLTLESLAIIFSRVLIRSQNEKLQNPHTHNEESKQYYEEQKAKAQFIGHFLKESKIWTRDDVVKTDELEEDIFEPQDEENHNTSLLSNDQLSNKSTTSTNTTKPPLSADEFL